MLRTSPASVAAVLGVLATGCLSIPPPSGGGGGDARVNDGSVGVDARPTMCGTVDDYDGQMWPPTAIQIGMRNILRVDINNDGAMDLVINNSELEGPSPDPNDYGFFILLGPQTVASSLDYHVFVHTSVIPWAITARDVTGDGCLDVLVYGANEAGTGGFIEVFENDTANHTFSRKVTKDAGYVPDGSGLSPVHITVGDFDGDGNALDVAVADLDRVKMFRVGGSLLDNLSTASSVDVGPTGAPDHWTDINGLFARPTATSGAQGDDLVVIRQQEIRWLRNDGAGNFGTPFTQSSSGMFISKTMEEVDLDHVPPLDFVAGSGTKVGAYLAAQNGETIELTARSWAGMPSFTGELDDVFVGNMNTTAAPELVILEADEPLYNDPSVAYLTLNLFDGASGLEPTTTTPFSFSKTPVAPVTGFIGDFNGDQVGELWVFERGGTATCLRANGAALELCD